MPSGVYVRKGVHGARFRDLTNYRVLGATVVRFSRTENKKLSYWWLLCDCGKEFEALGTNITRPNHTTSCGCRQAEITRLRSTIHGYSKRGKRTKEYRTWCDIKKRIDDPKQQNYKYYGGRGIKMCQGLRESHKAIIDVVGLCPPDKTSIDRVKNQLNYSCGKCSECNTNGWNMNLRWATQYQQVHNRG